MRARVRKWGNSLAVRIPKPYAEEARLKPSTEVEMVVEGRTLKVTAVRPGRRLRELLAGVSRKNLHSEIDMGPRVGKESL